MNLRSLLPFLKREPDEVWVTSISAHRELNKQKWVEFFFEIEDNLGGPFDLLDKHDPVRRNVASQTPEQLADYVIRITKNDGLYVFGERHYDSLSFSCWQNCEDGIPVLSTLFSRPYSGDIDDLMDWANETLCGLVKVFLPFAAGVELRSRCAAIKKMTLLGADDKSWIRGQIPRLGWKQYFGKHFTGQFISKWDSLSIPSEPLGHGTLLTLSDRIDRVDERLVDEIQFTLAGSASLPTLPFSTLIEE